MPTPLSSLLLAGATGLVGHQALLQALAWPGLQAVHALVRRPPAQPPADPRLHWLQVDFGNLPALPRADVALCALGTTIKVAGSQRAFHAVDHDAVLAFARAARAAGVTRLGVVSALGADARSAVFYNRVKGQAEVALQTLDFQALVIARPSLLVGDRAALGQPVRMGERLTLAVTGPLSPLVPKAWRPIGADRVARALLRTLAAGAPGVQVIESGLLQDVGAP